VLADAYRVDDDGRVTAATSNIEVR